VNKQREGINRNANDGKRILCIGGANVDKKIQVLAEAAFGTSNPAVSKKSRGGVARNVAENLGRLGVKTALLSYVGDDPDGEWLLQYTKEFVDIRPSQIIEGNTTGCYTALLDVNGQMIIGLAEMAIYNKAADQFVEENKKYLQESDIILLDMNYPKHVIHQMIEHCKNEKIPLCIATVSASKTEKLPDSLEGVTWLMANHKEAEALSQMKIVNDGDIFRAAEKILKKGPEKVVITRGEKGLIYFSKLNEIGALVAPDVPVVDVTGAGDSLIAGILYAYMKGLNIEDSCKIGMTCSLMTIQSNETVTPELNQQSLLTVYHTYFSKGIIFC